MNNNKLNRLIYAVEKFGQMVEGLKSPINSDQENLYKKFEQFIFNIVGKNLNIEDIHEWYKINKSSFDLISPMGYMFTKVLGKDLSLYSDRTYGLISINQVDAQTEHPEQFMQKELKQDILLSGYKDIPNLHLSIYEYPIKKVNPLIDSDLSHNYFIVQALYDKFGVNLNKPDDIENVKNFIHTNRNKINNIRRVFTITPRKLGTGADGTAFAVSDTMVLKIFQSEFAYKSSLDAIERLHSQTSAPGQFHTNKKNIKEKSTTDPANTEAMIYDAGILGTFKGSSVYYYLIEKMLPVRDMPDDSNKLYVHKIITEITSTIEYQSFEIWDDKDLKTKKMIIEKIEAGKRQLINDLKRRYGDKLKKIEESGILAPNWLSTFIEEVYFKTVTERKDLHTGNIGINNTKHLRFFDPAYRYN